MKSYEEKAYSALKRIEEKKEKKYYKNSDTRYEPLPRGNFRDWNLAIRHV